MRSASKQQSLLGSISAHIIAAAAVLALMGPEAVAKPKCEVFTNERGVYRVEAKNERWVVTLKDRAEDSLFLWFTKSSPGLYKPLQVSSRVSADSSIGEAEVTDKTIGNAVMVRLIFDGDETVEIKSPFERRTHRSKPYYFWRWNTLLSTDEHIRVLNLAKASTAVTIEVVDAQSSHLFRRTHQALQGVTAAVTEAEAEFKRIERAEPPGSCTRF